jgi:3-hydroxyisobutyrate dehydrogenase-like beta-hydroxyacid dehydrogenase
MSEYAQQVAIIGLGRMGSAMAGRLSGLGWPVIRWTRSGRGVDGITTVADPDKAISNADVVLLSLFDGPACIDVLTRIRSSLRWDAIVVNTSTISPAEAAAFANDLGDRYVHAPVLGSVPAVDGGTLQILVGAQGPALDAVRPLLEALGTVRPVGNAATAAALKLVANSSLAGALSALRESLRQADALGLPRDQTLDLLELGQLGGLVARKRSFLAGEPGEAQFTIGALAKDMALLAGASDTPLPAAAELEQSTAGRDADIALVATEPAVDEDVLAPLRAYMRGHASGDPTYFRESFLPTAHVEGIRDGAFVSWNLADYCALFDGTPAPDEPMRSRRIDRVDVHGSVATASMTLRHGVDTFTDIFILIRVDGQWRIANKAYHRHA